MVAVATTASQNDARTRARPRRWRVLDADGGVVANEVRADDGAAGRERDCAQRVAVATPRLWSPDRPTLYTSYHGRRGGRPPRRGPHRFGIRRCSSTPSRASASTASDIELRGACVHHDNGPLGAATIDAAEDRRVESSRRPGSTPSAAPTTRSAAPSSMPATATACSSWTSSPTSGRVQDGLRLLADLPRRWRQDLEAIVAKDYNHPSVDHVLDRQRDLRSRHPDRRDLGARLAEKIRALDDTRFVTKAINGAHRDNGAAFRGDGRGRRGRRSRQHHDGRHGRA